MLPERVRLLQPGKSGSGPVVYWMSRDQRASDNWALVFASQIAREASRPVVVVFSLLHSFHNAGLRQFAFLLKGLQEVEKTLVDAGIPFILLMGEPAETIPALLKEYDAHSLVADFDPLRVKRIWKRDTAATITTPFYEVDAHNIVPALYVSNKEEFAAYTLRPKIHKYLPSFVDEYPGVSQTPGTVTPQSTPVQWQQVFSALETLQPVPEVRWITPGEIAANEALDSFLRIRLSVYNEKRNNPMEDGQSNLSPYLHFGQLSAQRIALHVQKYFPSDENTASFLEELIVRRELADNFCYFNRNYDTFEGFQPWAKASLNAHRDDRREYTYSTDEFERAVTHEALWNAAQNQLVQQGKMHGYMRMYWAKKILEWSASPEEALQTSIFLNDKYELDGRDPNGYCGCAWSIGGIHDRPWAERPVYGKIRYMNENGCRRKFDVDGYIARYGGGPAA